MADQIKGPFAAVAIRGVAACPGNGRPLLWNVGLDPRDQTAYFPRILKTRMRHGWHPHYRRASNRSRTSTYPCPPRTLACRELFLRPWFTRRGRNRCTRSRIPVWRHGGRAAPIGLGGCSARVPLRGIRFASLLLHKPYAESWRADASRLLQRGAASVELRIRRLILAFIQGTPTPELERLAAGWSGHDGIKQPPGFACARLLEFP